MINRLEREGGAIALAERIFGLFDQGRFTSTYKYAVLLALIDLCLEKTTKQGFSPDTITTRELAEKVVHLYWPQVVAFGRGREASVLLQNTGRRQAEMVGVIARFRSAFPNDPLLPIERARNADVDGFRDLLDEIEWKLIEMPLPRLQAIGGTSVPFLYDISWNESIPVGLVRAYQHGKGSDFDNRIRLKAGVGDQLVQLNGLIRPLLCAADGGAWMPRTAGR